jgi:DUF3073 family protein
MGRGRAKAKQTKVARELKYSTHGTDLDALRAELAGERTTGSQDTTQGFSDEDDLEDPYAEYVDDDEDDDEDGDEEYDQHGYDEGEARGGLG